MKRKWKSNRARRIYTKGHLYLHSAQSEEKKGRETRDDSAAAASANFSNLLFAMDFSSDTKGLVS